MIHGDNNTMNISFKWIGGATWILRAGSITIACDPVLCPAGHMQDYKYFKTKRRTGPVYDKADFKNITLWLLTHNHEDHLDSYGSEVIQKDATVIADKGLTAFLKKEAFPDARILKWNEKTVVEKNDMAITVTAVPAIHAKKAFLSGAIGNGNGYLLEIASRNSRYVAYVTGDAVYRRNIRERAGIPPIDLIIANAGAAKIGTSLPGLLIGRITNSIHDLKRMYSELKPKRLIPVHWGTFTHYTESIPPDAFINHGGITTVNAGEWTPLS